MDHITYIYIESLILLPFHDLSLKEKDYNESLDLFIELFGCETFDNPFGGGSEAQK